MYNTEMRRIIPAVVAVALLALTGCASAPSLQSELRSMITASDGGSFTLAALDSVDGSDFLVVCPYESTSSVEARLGFSWADTPDYSQVDSRQTIAFIDDGEVVSHVELRRDEVDFCSAEQWEVLPVGTALDVARAGDILNVTV